MAARRGIDTKAAKETFLKLLAHENTRTFLGKLAGGEDPRRATAELAGAAITTKVVEFNDSAALAARPSRPRPRRCWAQVEGVRRPRVP